MAKRVANTWAGVSPLEPSINKADEAQKRTLEVWSKRSARPLSKEDARQIAENAIGFFRVLIEWKARKLEATIGKDRFAA